MNNRREEYPFHQQDDFKSETHPDKFHSINYKHYKVEFKRPNKSNLDKEGKLSLVHGIHPDHSESIDKVAGMKTHIGQVVHMSVHNTKTGDKTDHHLFQSTSGLNPISSVSPLSDHKKNDEHTSIIKNVLSTGIPKEE